jgi:hypothetical protein
MNCVFTPPGIMETALDECGSAFYFVTGGKI